MNETPFENNVTRVLDAVDVFQTELRPDADDSTLAIVRAYEGALKVVESLKISKFERARIMRSLSVGASNYAAFVAKLNKSRARRAALANKTSRSFVVAASYLASIAAPLYWGDWRLVWTLAPAVLLHYLLLSDSRPARWLQNLLRLRR